MSSWKTLSSQLVYSCGRWLSVEDRTVQTPEGEVIEHWNWVVTPDFVNVLAQTPDGRYLIFRQGKYGFEGDSFAPVGGYIEPGEDPLSAAQRELLEETGYQAEDWLDLGGYQVDPNRGVANGHFFLARSAQPVAQPSGGDLEEQHLMFFERVDLEKALKEGRFKVMAWASCVAMALLFGDASRNSS
jgi:ADP-ribose pyrophosphatase